jgi:cytidylate kinase
MSVITISRQLGSWGQETAAAVATRLGYRLISRDLITRAAREAGAPELALATIDELGLLDVCPSPAACRKYRQSVEQIMRNLAAEDQVVIVGRAGQIILRDYPESLHVRVMAPAHTRAERLAHEQGIPLRAAQAQIEASDHFRRHYVRQFYHVRWDDPELYDLVVNTEHIDPERAAEIVVSAWHRTDAQHSILAHPGAAF